MADSNGSMKQSVVEEGTEIDGNIRSNCPVKVSGVVRGQVGAPSLTVTPSGSVHGEVKVSQLKSDGELSGHIEAESVELSGRVRDNTSIRATTLEVKLAQPDGKLQLTFGSAELVVGERPTARKETAPEKAHSN